MSDNPSTPSAGASSSSAGSTASATNASTSSASVAKAAVSEQNPALKMMGLPRWRNRLPSRNWSIFLSIVGSFAGAVIYDKYQTKQIRQKWCRTVEHLAEESLSIKSLPRRLTIYLAAPPGDGLRSAREHFHAYIKPVLVASGTDWDVVEGRREGDVRWKTAERIRRRRRRDGEAGAGDEDQDAAGAVHAARLRSGTTEYPGVAGDLIVGRHTWREYIRGMHEGWLGPATAPVVEEELSVGQEPLQQQSSPGHSSVGDAAVTAATNITTPPSDQKPIEDLASLIPKDDKAPVAPEEETPKEDDKPPEKPKPRNPPPLIETTAYSSTTPSRNMPEVLGPSTTISFPHILGFRNTPLRTYRFLTRRRLADEIGGQVAAAVLASHRALDPSEASALLEHEEQEWSKTVRDRPERMSGESEKEGWIERVWTEDLVLDERLASRMRVFELSAEDAKRAKMMASAKAKKVDEE